VTATPYTPELAAAVLAGQRWQIVVGEFQLSFFFSVSGSRQTRMAVSSLAMCSRRETVLSLRVQ
jgi:hypothetical protein